MDITCLGQGVAAYILTAVVAVVITVVIILLVNK